MPSRRILNPQPPPETEIDTAEAASAVFIASREAPLKPGEDPTAPLGKLIQTATILR